MFTSKNHDLKFSNCIKKKSSFRKRKTKDSVLEKIKVDNCKMKFKENQDPHLMVSN